jgi:Flp pilus assembly pilin Flp
LILAFVVVVAAAITNAGGLRTKVQEVFTNITNAF